MKQHGSLHVYCFVVIQKRRSFLQSAAKLGLLLHYFFFLSTLASPNGRTVWDWTSTESVWNGRDGKWRKGWNIGGILLLFATLAYHSHLSSCTSCSSLHISRFCFRPHPAHFSLNILHDSDSFLLVGPFPKYTYNSMHHSIFISFSNTFSCSWKFDNRKAKYD